MANSVQKMLLMISSGAALFAAPVSAADRQQLVTHHDLDLSTQMGQAILKKRVNSAVIRVCASHSARSLAEREDQKRCETRARTNAMRQVAQTIARRGAAVKIAVE